MKKFYLSLILLLSVSAYTQDAFDVVLWHEQGGLVSDVASNVDIKTQMETHWYDQHLPSMISLQLHIHVLKSVSIQNYLQQIKKIQPGCIEGDPVFVEQSINQQQNISYIPVLQSSESSNAVIVFRSPYPNWNGKLGVVDPNYGVGGWLQIENWKQQTGKNPDVRVFDTVQEVLMHMMVGSVDAAAVPEGALESFLQQQNREAMIERFYIESVPNPYPSTMIFLREDIYRNTLQRTLISETWLRDIFSKQLHIVSQPIGFIDTVR